MKADSPKATSPGLAVAVGVGAPAGSTPAVEDGKGVTERPVRFLCDDVQCIAFVFDPLLTGHVGQVISDIVSLDWTGSVGPLSEELITFTVMVDDGFEGTITNTAIIAIKK